MKDFLYFFRACAAENVSKTEMMRMKNLIHRIITKIIKVSIQLYPTEYLLKTSYCNSHWARKKTSVCLPFQIQPPLCWISLSFFCGKFFERFYRLDIFCKIFPSHPNDFERFNFFCPLLNICFFLKQRKCIYFSSNQFITFQKLYFKTLCLESFAYRMLLELINAWCTRYGIVNKPIKI